MTVTVVVRACVCVAQEGWSALLMAADKELVPMVSLLLQSGANVNLQNKVLWPLFVPV